MFVAQVVRRWFLYSDVSLFLSMHVCMHVQCTHMYRAMYACTCALFDGFFFLTLQLFLELQKKLA